jgi:hypothetical protein
MTRRVKVLVKFDTATRRAYVESKSSLNFNSRDEVEIPHFNDGFKTNIFGNESDGGEETLVVWRMIDTTNVRLRFRTPTIAIYRTDPTTGQKTTVRAESDTNPNGARIFGNIATPGPKRLRVEIINQNDLPPGYNFTKFAYTLFYEYSINSGPWVADEIDPFLTNYAEYD